MTSYPTSDLSMENVLRDVHDPENQLLRTSATISGATIEVNLNYETSSVALGDPVTNSILKINSDGSIDANVALNAFASTPDSAIAVGTSDGTLSGTKNPIKVNASGVQSSLMMNSIVPVEFDGIFPAYPSSSQEVYVYKKTGSTVATVTVTYVDASKNEIISIVRT